MTDQLSPRDLDYMTTVEACVAEGVKPTYAEVGRRMGVTGQTAKNHQLRVDRYHARMERIAAKAHVDPSEGGRILYLASICQMIERAAGQHALARGVRERDIASAEKSVERHSELLLKAKERLRLARRKRAIRSTWRPPQPRPVAPMHPRYDPWREYDQMYAAEREARRESWPFSDVADHRAAKRAEERARREQRELEERRKGFESWLAEQDAVIRDLDRRNREIARHFNPFGRPE